MKRSWVLVGVSLVAMGGWGCGAETFRFSLSKSDGGTAFDQGVGGLSFLPAVNTSADGDVANPDVTDAGTDQDGDGLGDTSTETARVGTTDTSPETDDARPSDTSMAITGDEPSASCAGIDAGTMDLGNSIDVDDAGQMDTQAADAARRNTLCVGLQAWSEAASDQYTSGWGVKNGEPPHAYRCRAGAVSGWCPLASYEPGVANVPWHDAWQDLGPCD